MINRLLPGCLLACLAAEPARALNDRFWDYYDPRPSSYIGSSDWWQGDSAMGDWWGMRNWLDRDAGVEFSVTYTTDLAGNPVGGMQPGFTYTDNIAFGVKLDLEKSLGWKGGMFTIAATQRDGDSLSQDFVGNQFTVQQIYGGQTTIFTTMFLAQKFWDDRAELKAGWFSSGDDFASSPLYWLYMNNGIDGNPQALPVNASFSAYPWASWAARLRVEPTPETHLMAGLYQVSARTFSRSLNGVNMGFEPTDGVMFLGQAGWTPELWKRAASAGDTPRGLPGHYWFGGYFSTWQYPQFGTTDTAPNTYGFYWHADQMVWQEAPGSAQGLTLWTAFVHSPQENISKIPFQWNAGAVWQGLVPRRDDDIAMFGLVYGDFSGDYSDAGLAYEGNAATFELALEWGYRVQLNSWLYVQPNVQYIVQPGGTGEIPDALVLGMQAGVTF